MQTGDVVQVDALLGTKGQVARNTVSQVARPICHVVLGTPVRNGGDLVGFETDPATGLLVLLDGARVPKGMVLAASLKAGASAKDGTPLARWMHPRPPKPADDPDLMRRRLDALASWDGKVVLTEEVPAAPGRPRVDGLRSPQVGAVYGLLAHWKASDGPATVVMPTGTGKTETMLTLLVRQRFQRLLVLVPTDALRGQIAGKFDTLGKLRQLGVVPEDVLNPVVGRFERGLRTAEEARAFLEPCNVVVATVAILAVAPDEVRRVFAELCSTLFIDEAHHTGAESWAAIRGMFVGQAGKQVVQFTATPFREDGRLVDGKVAFRFPLKRAMEEGYFRPIRYVPVDTLDEDDADHGIAVRALRALEDDLAAGFDHVLMARTKGIERAAAVQAIYRALAPQHSPVVVHSKLKPAELAEAHAMLRDRRTRVIVCVDMLGEGFDFPHLKVAALHDAHRSLAVTLQFLGRFTREAPELGVGNATAVASLADRKMDRRVQALFAEDADWSLILQTLSEEESGAAEERNEFLQGFGDTEGLLVPLRHILPKMSTAVFKTAASTWNPFAIGDALGAGKTVAMPPVVNSTKRTVLVVTHEQLPVPWGRTKVVFDSLWHLFLAHWDEATNLLFINTSDHGASLDAMAAALMGGEPVPVRGDEVFKGFYGIRRMVLMNVGLKHELNSRFTRFSMLVGPDVAQAIGKATLANKTRTNIFAVGLERGRRTTIGASAKGRIWSHSVAPDISRWVAWCGELGRKLRDPAANSDTVLAGALVPQEVSARPASVPLYIEWSSDIAQRPEEAVHLEFDGQDVPLLHASLELVAGGNIGPLRFTVASEGASREFEVQFPGPGKGARYVQTGGSAVRIRAGRRRVLLTEWFEGDPPIIIFADGSQLQGSVLCKPQAAPSFAPLADAQLQAWDWPASVDIRKESMRRHEGASYVTVQGHVLANIGGAAWAAASGYGYDLIVDDDDTGEAADIVAIGTVGDVVRVDLFHCKFSGAASPGARVDDLYAVCGQSARSVRWIGNPPRLLEHLVQRRADLWRSKKKERLVRGDPKALRRLAGTIRDSKVEFRVFAVQPGLSKAQVGSAENSMDLLASVDGYLRDAVELGFNVICSR